MKKIILIPDSFKGTMSSAEICEIMKKSIEKFRPETPVVSIPVADGGEGSVEAFLAACGGQKKNIRVKGPFFEDVPSFYGILNDKKTAVIEMAACAGLPLVGDALAPEKTTTYGVGQLIIDAVNSGCSKIIMGLGGSATNDGGCGAAAALGVKFFDKDNKEFVPTGGSLQDICKIDMSSLAPELKKCSIVTMCDIDNPLYGENGAAYVFGPQKGADPDAVKRLDKGLRHLAQIVQSASGADAALTPGAGAAGGMGYGMNVFLKSKLQMGIETVLDTVNFDSILKDAECVFSGEGKIDTQSLRGKVVIGIAKRTKKADVPLIAVVGDIGDDIEEAYTKGVSAIFSTNRVAVDYSKAKLRAKKDMALTMENIMRFSDCVLQMRKK
ncbi:glycerate kinase [Treponema parvum]|uniref:Glycerate kinase n=1 Tax=Treponema parvum TaxID=138851 RepID=A0A975F347_9SPIR|nr:glycerate kinase [Treponema parvum]QTQ13522.1 glycerate kinase [Treponema parvum]